MLDDRKTGYRWLAPLLDGGRVVGYHPGEDLNSGRTAYADLGLPIWAMAVGKVIFARNLGGGWGNMMVIHHPELGVWSRYAHLLDFRVRVGDLVKVGEVIGRCGKSGTAAPHLHWEVLKKALPDWSGYVRGWSQDRIREFFVAPYAFVKSMQESVPRVSDFAQDAVAWGEMLGIAKDWSNPQQPIATADARTMLYRSGLLNTDTGKELTKEELMLMIYREQSSPRPSE